MSLKVGLSSTLDQLLLTKCSSISKEKLIDCLDLTLLDNDASFCALDELCSQGEKYPVASLCVLPSHLTYCKKNSNQHLATVANFPHGTNEFDLCLSEIRQAIELGANEIDYVLPYINQLNKKKQTLQNYSVIQQICQENGIILKVILETELFPNIEFLYEISAEIIEIGCDFLKTSTGKLPQGACLATVFSLLTAIKDVNMKTGIKISGGVKTITQACQFAYLAELILAKPIDKTWFRIGASSLLNKLVQ